MKLLRLGTRALRGAAQGGAPRRSGASCLGSSSSSRPLQQQQGALVVVAAAQQQQRGWGARGALGGWALGGGAAPGRRGAATHSRAALTLRAEDIETQTGVSIEGEPQGMR